MHWQEECQLVYLLHQWYAWPQILAKACMTERDEGAALLAHSHWYSNEQRRPVWIAQAFGGDHWGESRRESCIVGVHNHPVF
jgi:hypothetical protein